jgi:pilus assembly protein CpaB
MMLRIALFIVLFLGVAGAGMVGWIELHQTKATHQQAAAEAASAAILVAARDVPGGSLLQPADLAAASKPADEIPAGATIDTAQNRTGLIGAMARQTLPAGQPILPAQIIRPGEHGFLAAVLKPGMRAVSVGVDAITGTAGLIWPGDQVDLLLTQTLNLPAISVGHGIASETILSDVRVIAIDQRLVQGAASDPTAAHGMAQTVTLEVSPVAAEKVEVASRLGPLSLVVRAAEQKVSAAAPPPIFSGDVSPVLDGLGNRRPTPDGGRMRVFQGTGAGIDYQF